ncbi:hypothetical protein [Desulfosporosinus sp. OT]|uniref:hypothetical protein n=1 Tax=Desulfosporosinus sp. OT TaxID=913865 RepID=UPI000223ABE3|nr:hypothetical protein [Desulfosporosinus sp. OT]EGW40328.1 hypothetical protein DOT_1667 [Desulfosporosinus sp. OT]
MKKNICILCGILLIGFLIIVINYNCIYSIGNNNMEYNIKGFINRPKVITNNIYIKQTIDIENRRYVLFTFNDYLGNAELVRGLNGKYKIESTISGSNLFEYRVREINKSKYFVVAGKNFDLKIDYAKVSLDNNEYKIIIPCQEYFIAYCAVSNNTLNIFPVDSGLKLFEKNNIEITNDIYIKFSH